jgi:hypothetical protein
VKKLKMTKFTPIYAVISVIGIASALVPQIPQLAYALPLMPLSLAFFFFAITQRQSVERARHGGLRLIVAIALLLCGLGVLGSDVDIAHKAMHFLAMIIFAMGFGRTSNFKNERPYLAENLLIMLAIPFTFLVIHATMIRTLGFTNFPVMACEVGAVVIVFAALNRKYDVSTQSHNTVVTGTFIFVASLILYAFANYSFLNNEDYEAYLPYMHVGYIALYALGLFLITKGILQQIDGDLPDESEIGFLDIDDKVEF